MIVNEYAILEKEILTDRSVVFNTIIRVGENRCLGINMTSRDAAEKMADDINRLLNGPGVVGVSGGREQ